MIQRYDLIIAVMITIEAAKLEENSGLNGI